MGKKDKIMAEWILTDKDIGMDGAYYDYPELIRCKDCEYRCLPNQTHMPDMYPCKVWGKEVYPHEWCSRAERKQDDA